MSDSCLGCSLSSGGPRNGAPTGAQHLGRMPLQSFHSSPQQAYNFLELCALNPHVPKAKAEDQSSLCDSKLESLNHRMTPGLQRLSPQGTPRYQCRKTRVRPYCLPDVGRGPAHEEVKAPVAGASPQPWAPVSSPETLG